MSNILVHQELIFLYNDENLTPVGDISVVRQWTSIVENNISCLSNFRSLSYRSMNMASSCMQLCLQCRRFLLSKPVASAWHYCCPASGAPTNVVNTSAIVRWSHKTTWTQQRLIRQILFFNDFAVKHLSTDTKGKNGIEELSITDVVSYKSPLLPVKDAVPSSFNQMSLGKF